MTFKQAPAVEQGGLPEPKGRLGRAFSWVRERLTTPILGKERAGTKASLAVGIAAGVLASTAMAPVMAVTGIGIGLGIVAATALGTAIGVGAYVYGDRIKSDFGVGWLTGP
jgi:hypothetical protein